MYTGSLGEPAKGKEAELLAAADKYSLLELKKQCEKVCWTSCDLNQKPKFISQVLCQEVHAATVLSLLVVADRHDAVELKNTCVKVHLSACLPLSNINFLKDPLFLDMIISNKHHSGSC